MAATASLLSWDIWPAFVIVPVLGAITLPLVRQGLRKDPDPLIGRIVVVGSGKDAGIDGSLRPHVRAL